jgi:hypothetical protein
LASDRPFRRQAIKLVAALCLGRGRAHYHNWLPSLRIEGRGAGRPGRVVHRGRPIVDLGTSEVLRARAFRSIVIVGSGPSVKQTTLRGLPEHSALLLNGAISLIGEQVAEPLAVAIEDERFVWRHHAMIAGYVGPDIPLLLSVGVIRALCEIDPSFLEGRTIVLIDDIRKPYGAPRREDTELAAMPGVTLRGGAGFSGRPDSGVFQGGSVVVSALQLALAVGADTIGFIGVDIVNADAPRFYEQAGDAAYSGVAGAEKRILDHIALARDMATPRGTRLVNYSEISALAAIGLDYEPLGTSAT